MTPREEAERRRKIAAAEASLAEVTRPPMDPVLEAIRDANNYHDHGGVMGTPFFIHWLEWSDGSRASEEVDELFRLSFEASYQTDELWGYPIPKPNTLALPYPGFLGNRVKGHWPAAYEDVIRDYADPSDARRVPRRCVSDLIIERDATERQVRRSWEFLTSIFDRAQRILKVWLAEAAANMEPYSWRREWKGKIHVAGGLDVAGHLYADLRFGEDLTRGLSVEEMGRWWWWRRLQKGPVPAVLAEAQLMGVLYCIRMRDEVLKPAARLEARRRALDHVVYCTLLGEPLPWVEELGMMGDGARLQAPPWLHLLEKRRSNDLWGPLRPFLDYALQTAGPDSDKYPAAVEHFATVCARFRESRSYCEKNEIDLADLSSRLSSQHYSQLCRAAKEYRVTRDLKGKL